MAVVECLPPEVLELLFQNLDGQSFIYCFRVCRKWNQVARTVDKLFWKKACLSEIDADILQELCSVHNLHSIHNNEKWKTVYAEWARPRMIEMCKSMKKSFIWSDPANVSCIKYSGSWIITGHNCGSIYIWDPFKGKEGIIVQHLSYIKDLALVDLLRAGPYGNIEKPWFHHHLISISDDMYVQLKYLLLECMDDGSDVTTVYQHSCQMKNVKVSDNKVVISATDNVYLLFSLTYEKKPVFKVNMTLVKSIIGPREYMECFNFCNHEIVGICDYGRVGSYSFEMDEWIFSSESIIPDSHSSRDHSMMFFRKFFIFRGNIIFIRTEFGKIFISVNQGRAKKHKTMPGTIVTIAFQGSLLAFGTDLGKLFLYYVPNSSSISNLDIEKPLWSTDLHMGPVKNIEISDDGKSPVVIACCLLKMVVIRWYR